MNRSLVFVVAALLLSTAPRSAGADQTYLREAEAPRTMFPESTGAERHDLELSDSELKWLERTMARRIDTAKYSYIEVRRQSESAGSIFILDVPGQSRPITFAVGVGEDGALKDVQVMVYREPQGEQITEPRFRRQFVGKRLADPIVPGKDVDVISGATISSRAATYAVRKALALREIMRARATAAR